MGRQRCSAIVATIRGVEYRCNRKATRQRDGAGYCAACDPVEAAARKAKESKGARVDNLGAALVTMKNRLGQAECWRAMHAMDLVMKAYASDIDPEYGRKLRD